MIGESRSATRPASSRACCEAERSASRRRGGKLSVRCDWFSGAALPRCFTLLNRMRPAYFFAANSVRIQSSSRRFS